MMILIGKNSCRGIAIVREFRGWPSRACEIDGYE
jgi:hypothetical protein